MGKVLITDTILRDAHQSQAATRMRLDEMLPVADLLDKVGYYSLECWGGATFDSCLRFLNEDPWDRLRQLRKAMPNTKLQMLLRGQNLLGYKHYADDVVDMFVKKSIDNGIDIIRIFDALNDLRNLERSVKACKEYNGIAECAISYTKSPVHTTEYFVELAVKMEEMGADTICIKDMANLLLPYDAYDLVSKLKARVHVPIHLHTHNTTGTGDMTYLKAIEAGVDIVDTALSPLGNGTSQPATEPLVAALQGTQYDTGLSLDLRAYNLAGWRYQRRISEILPNARHFRQHIHQFIFLPCLLQLAEYLEQEEDVLSYALFPQVAMNFFKNRQAEKYELNKNLMDKENAVHPV